MQRIRIFIKYKVLASPLKEKKKKERAKNWANRMQSEDPTLEAIRTGVF